MRYGLALLLLLTACTKPAGHLPGDVVFLGDSLTARMRVADVSPGSHNYAFSGATTADLLRYLPDYRVESAGVVVLTIGSNDVHRGEMAGLHKRLSDISAAIPGTLVWNALPPQAGKDVGPVNEAIRDLCRARDNCLYVATHFEPEDLDPDGLHLTPAGCARWTGVLRVHVPIITRGPPQVAGRF
jgi:lysophospholipase L1-like esterase